MNQAPKDKHESVQELHATRESLWTKTGQHQFTKAVIEAELIQFNQQILDINNKLRALSDKEKESSIVVPKEETTQATNDVI